MIPPIVGPSGPEKPKVDWHQTDATLTLAIYTRRKYIMMPEHVIVDHKPSPNNYLHVLVHLPDDHTAFNLAYE